MISFNLENINYFLVHRIFNIDYEFFKAMLKLLHYLKNSLSSFHIHPNRKKL